MGGQVDWRAPLCARTGWPMPIFKIRRLGHVDGVADEYPIFEDSPEAAIEAYNADEAGRGAGWPRLKIFEEGAGTGDYLLIEENEHLRDVDEIPLARV